MELVVPTPKGAAPARQDWSRQVDKRVFAAPFANWIWDWLDVPALAEEASIGRALERYEAERREATGRIILANRGNGPDQVMQLAQARAPGGFRHVNEVIAQAELEAISARYKQTAGCARAQVKRKIP